jgi:hypothetical protein
MKKLIIFTIIATGVIFLGVKLSPSAFSNMTKVIDNTAAIHYQVDIHPDWRINQNACPLEVQMTNGSGMLIGLPQLYHKGMNIYNFYEVGPVMGKRVAQLLNTDEGLPDDVCILISLSDSQSGTFNDGETYAFNLFGSVKDISVPFNTTGNE